METWITMALAESLALRTVFVLLLTLQKKLLLFMLHTYSICTFLNRVSSIFQIFELVLKNSL